MSIKPEIGYGFRQRWLRDRSSVARGWAVYWSKLFSAVQSPLFSVLCPTVLSGSESGEAGHS